MSPVTTSITCACGAKYERAVAHLPIKDIGIYECQHCGATLERWCGRDVPLFKFVCAPAVEDASAA